MEENTVNANGLKDTTIMAFGKFKGHALANVPAWYLLWLPKQEWFKTNPLNTKLMEYIKLNEDVLEKEVSDEKQDR